AQDPAHGVERARAARRSSPARRARRGRPRLFRPQLSSRTRRLRRARCGYRLRRPARGDHRARQSRPDPVPPRKEPGNRVAADWNLLAMASMSDARSPGAVISVERVTRYSGTDLDDLCEATESAITEGGGFGWLKPPPRQVLENYWKGVLLVPERRLVAGRLD